jgi:hypothetical protein
MADPPSTQVLSSMVGLEMSSPPRSWGKRPSLLLTPKRTQSKKAWSDDMERAHYVVLLKLKHENWLRK